MRRHDPVDSFLNLLVVGAVLSATLYLLTGCNDFKGPKIDCPGPPIEFTGIQDEGLCRWKEHTDGTKVKLCVSQSSPAFSGMGAYTGAHRTCVKNYISTIIGKCVKWEQ